MHILQSIVHIEVWIAVFSLALAIVCLPIQGLIVSLIVALGSRLAWAQLINSTTDRAQP